MNKKIKKILAIIICVVMVVLCTINAGAAKITTQPTQPSKPEKYSSFELINESINIPNNKAYLSTFNQSDDTRNTIHFEPVGSTGWTDDILFKNYVNGDYISVDADITYTVYIGIRRDKGSSSGSCIKRDFKNTQGKYEKVRINLSDFNSYFNSDGSAPEKDLSDGEIFVHHFGAPEKSGDKTYYSALMFFSGAAFTSITPDENGDAEFYVSTQIGEFAYFTTEFGKDQGNSGSGGGGVSGREIPICKGNASADNVFLEINDVTFVQMYLASMLDKELTDLQKFNSDANNDGIIDIKDATYIQLYLADML